MDDLEQRPAQNEALFREVNERVEAVAHQLGPSIPDEFLCECARTDCTSRVAVPIDEYEAVREDPTQFLVLPRHYTPDVEELVVEADSYWVVRKTGEAGEYVKRVDPRRR